MAGPADGAAAWAGDRDHLRVSHADREQVVGTLKAAFVQGMLAKDELDLRVGQALTSRTYADLAPLTADLPAGLAAAQPPEPARAEPGRPLLRPGQIAVGATVVYGGAWASALLIGGYPGVGALLFLGGYIYLGILLVAVSAALEIRRDRHSGGLRQTPGAGGGSAFGYIPPARPGQPRPVDPGRRHAAEASRRRGSRTRLATSGHVAHAARHVGTAVVTG